VFPTHYTHIILGFSSHLVTLLVSLPL